VLLQKQKQKSRLNRNKTDFAFAKSVFYWSYFFEEKPSKNVPFIKVGGNPINKKGFV
jgi:hypothetical protein